MEFKQLNKYNIIIIINHTFGSSIRGGGGGVGRMKYDIY